MMDMLIMMDMHWSYTVSLATVISCMQVYQIWKKVLCTRKKINTKLSSNLIIKIGSVISCSSMTEHIRDW